MEGKSSVQATFPHVCNVSPAPFVLSKSGCWAVCSASLQPSGTEHPGDVTFPRTAAGVVLPNEWMSLCSRQPGTQCGPRKFGSGHWRRESPAAPRRQARPWFAREASWAGGDAEAEGAQHHFRAGYCPPVMTSVCWILLQIPGKQ